MAAKIKSRVYFESNVFSGGKFSKTLYRVFNYVKC